MSQTHENIRLKDISFAEINIKPFLTFWPPIKTLFISFALYINFGLTLWDASRFKDFFCCVVKFDKLILSLLFFILYRKYLESEKYNVR